MTARERAEALEATWDLKHAGGQVFTHDDLVADIATAIQAAVAAEREACAKVADDHQAPYYVDHPRYGFLQNLIGVVLQAMIDYDRADDSQPETQIAEAVLAFLEAKPDRHGTLRSPALPAQIAAAIRARGTTP